MNGINLVLCHLNRLTGSPSLQTIRNMNISNRLERPPPDIIVLLPQKGPSLKMDRENNVLIKPITLDIVVEVDLMEIPLLHLADILVLYISLGRHPTPGRSPRSRHDHIINIVDPLLTSLLHLVLQQHNYVIEPGKLLNSLISRRVYRILVRYWDKFRTIVNNTRHLTCNAALVPLERPLTLRPWHLHHASPQCARLIQNSPVFPPQCKIKRTFSHDMVVFLQYCHVTTVLLIILDGSYPPEGLSPAKCPLQDPIRVLTNDQRERNRHI